MQMRMVSEENLIALDNQLKEARRLYKEHVSIYEERERVEAARVHMLFDLVISLASIAEKQNGLLLATGALSLRETEDLEQRLNVFIMTAKNLQGR